MSKQQTRILQWQEIGTHITPSDCWLVIDGGVYSLTDFLVQHPGGDQVLLKWSGLDSTHKFNAVNHSQYANSLKNARLVGRVQAKEYPPGYEAKVKAKKVEQMKKAKPIIKITEPISAEMVGAHKSEDSCWIVLNKSVYDVTSYLEEHPGGVSKIMEYAGKDATQAFQKSGHSLQAIKKKQQFLIGTTAKPSNHPMIALVGVILILLTALACSSY